MNLIIDIGNTRAKLVAFDGNQIADHMICSVDLEEMHHFIDKNACKHGILSSTSKLSIEAEQRIAALPFNVLRMTGETPTPVNVRYRTPQTLGTDRLAAIVGAQAARPHENVMVIDCGTCITYDILDAEGNYWGGNISPGLNMRLQAMHQLTARLPMISQDGEVPQVGYNTETAIRSGAICGIKHEIEGYIREFQQKFRPLSVFLTGGDAKKLDISAEFTIFADDFIVPRGLNRILNYNK